MPVFGGRSIFRCVLSSEGRNIQTAQIANVGLRQLIPGGEGPVPAAS